MTIDGPLTWACHICGQVRPDDKIAVYTHHRQLSANPAISFQENVRYCKRPPQLPRRRPGQALDRGRQRPDVPQLMAPTPTQVKLAQAIIYEALATVRSPGSQRAIHLHQLILDAEELDADLRRRPWPPNPKFRRLIAPPTNGRR